MSKNLRRLAILFATVIMVMMMAVPAFADTLSANVHFITANEDDDEIYLLYDFTVETW